jgi:hypothetical protein
VLRSYSNSNGYSYIDAYIDSDRNTYGHSNS